MRGYKFTSKGEIEKYEEDLVDTKSIFEKLFLNIAFCIFVNAENSVLSPPRKIKLER